MTVGLVGNSAMCNEVHFIVSIWVCLCSITKRFLSMPEAFV